MKHRTSGALAALVLAVSGLATASPAHAGNYSYDNVPHTRFAVCKNSERRIYAHYLVRNYTTNDYSSASIELWYSTACRTVWAHVKGTTSIDPYDSEGGVARITRNNDGKALRCSVESGSSCYTNMLYDAGMTSFAGGSDDTGALIYSWRTPSY